MNRVRTIHHFEDQPENMSWIPGTLLNAYWADHPEWVREGGAFREDGRTTTFELFPPSGKVTIRYQVYETRLDFEQGCRPEPGDVVLLDVMGEQASTGCFEPDGLRLLEGLLARPEAAVTVYAVTAYPGRIPLPLRKRLTDERVFTKPMVVDTFIAALIGALEVGRNGTPRPGK